MQTQTERLDDLYFQLKSHPMVAIVDRLPTQVYVESFIGREQDLLQELQSTKLKITTTATSGIFYLE